MQTTKTELIQNLLHSERAAEQTYSQLLAGMQNPASGIEWVESFLMDHERAGEYFCRLLDTEHSAETEPEIAMWKDLSFIVENSVDNNPLQDPMTIKALQTGEERCRMDYEHAVESEVLDPETAQWLRAELIPATQKRLEELAQQLTSLRAA